MKTIEQWIDDWSDSLPWRESIACGDISPSDLLISLRELEQSNPGETPHPGTWEDVADVIESFK